jgi:MFS family permease
MIATLAASLLLMAAGHATPAGLVAALVLFFVAFNTLEGLLPSLISRRAPASHRGAALGVYSSAQFLGPMLGGALIGAAKGHWGLSAAFAVAALLPLLWLPFAIHLTPPRPRESLTSP